MRLESRRAGAARQRQRLLGQAAHASSSSRWLAIRASAIFARASSIGSPERAARRCAWCSSGCAASRLSLRAVSQARSAVLRRQAVVVAGPGSQIARRLRLRCGADEHALALPRQLQDLQRLPGACGSRRRSPRRPGTAERRAALPSGMRGQAWRSVSSADWASGAARSSRPAVCAASARTRLAAASACGSRVGRACACKAATHARASASRPLCASTHAARLQQRPRRAAGAASSASSACSAASGLVGVVEAAPHPDIDLLLERVAAPSAARGRRGLASQRQCQAQRERQRRGEGAASGGRSCQQRARMRPPPAAASAASLVRRCPAPAAASASRRRHARRPRASCRSRRAAASSRACSMRTP